MWNRNKKEDEIPVRPAAPAPSTADLSREGISMSTYPTRQEPSIRAAATIGKTLVVHGTISGREDLLVDGRMEGDIDLPENRLTVGAGGHLQGGVKARDVVVFGTVHGNLEATERIEIKRGAKVVGDLKTSRIVMEDESYFKGNVDTMKTDAPKPQSKPQAQAAAASPSTSADVQPSLISPEGKR
jgi:cytoskeletal protein CcmA (bactofilin family)